MKDSVSRIFSDKNKILLVTGLITLIFISSVYYGLSTYFEKASREVVESWYANELTNIQQGNVLSSVTKLQRTLDKSALVKGVLVVDRAGHDLVRFGTVPELKIGHDLTAVLKDFDFGLFAKAYAFRSGELEIYIITESRGLLFLVALFFLYLISVTFGFALFVRRNAIKEEKLKTEMRFQQIRLENEFNEKIADLSKKVAHDIRSPLSVLNIVSQKIKSTLPEEGVLLGDAATRIVQIADGLLNASRDKLSNPTIEIKKVFAEPKSKVSVEEFIKSCEQIVKEKKIEIGKSPIKIQFYNELSGHFNIVSDSVELSRIISNLLNNSIEAISESGFVSITVSDSSEGLLLEIRDSGKGMSQELIERVKNGPVTEGKARGNGLGLWPAILKIKEWNGNLNIRSSKNGTTVVVELLKFRE